MIRRWRRRVLVIFATVGAVFVLPVILLAIDGLFYVTIGESLLAPLTTHRAYVSATLGLNGALTALLGVVFHELCPKGDR